MSNFVPEKVFLQEVLLHYFNMKKTAAKSHHILVEVYGEHALAERTCQKWFAWFNTWINKSRDWHIDGVANKSSVWFFMSTNLQKIPVKISWHFDVWSTSYSDLSDPSLDILKTMDSKQFHVLIYHCFLMKKTQRKLSNGLKSATGTLFHQKQPFVGGMLSLNVVVQALKMLNASTG